MEKRQKHKRVSVPAAHLNLARRVSRGGLVWSAGGRLAPEPALAGPRLTTERLGPLPLVTEFLDRLDLDARSPRFVLSSERVRLPHAVALGALLRSLLVECESGYRQAEACASKPRLTGKTPPNAGALGLQRFPQQGRGLCGDLTKEVTGEDGVELRSGLPFDLCGGVFVAPGLFVGSVAGEGIVYIDEGEHPG